MPDDEATLLGTLEAHFEAATRAMGMNANVRKILGATAVETTVRFPVVMDSGGLEVFTGHHVQHNGVLGPHASGLRFHPAISLEDVRALSMGTTWKAAVCDIPFGGAQSAVLVDARARSASEIERVTRRFIFALGDLLGPEYGVLAPDLNTNAQIMAWALDTYLSMTASHQRRNSLHVVTGKPLASGGLAGRERAAGLGLLLVLEQWAALAGLDLGRASYVVQGFGNMGSWAARLLKRRGATLLAVQDRSGTVFGPDGIDPDVLVTYVHQTGGVAGFPGARSVDRETFFRTRADMFILAAMESQITARTAPLLNVRLVVEGANAAIDPAGDEVLSARRIDVLPDLLAGSGGIVVSYFEWLQNKRSEVWEAATVEAELGRRLACAWGRVQETAAAYRCNPRMAAYITALGRLERLYKERGIFP